MLARTPHHTYRECALLRRRIEFLAAGNVNLVQSALQLDSTTYRWLSNALTLPATAPLQPPPNSDMTDMTGACHTTCPHSVRLHSAAFVLF